MTVWGCGKVEDAPDIWVTPGVMLLADPLSACLDEVVELAHEVAVDTGTAFLFLTLTPLLLGEGCPSSQDGGGELLPVSSKASRLAMNWASSIVATSLPVGLPLWPAMNFNIFSTFLDDGAGISACGIGGFEL